MADGLLVSLRQGGIYFTPPDDSANQWLVDLRSGPMLTALY